jgi:hypothetical protein
MDSESAVHGADSTADCAANNTADGARRSTAFRRPALCASKKALSMK